MTLVIKSPTALKSPRYRAAPIVESLPVGGYTDRWDAESLTVAEGAKITALPNAVAGPWGAYMQPDPALQPILRTEGGFKHVANTATRAMFTQNFTTTGPKTMVGVGKVVSGATAVLFGTVGNWSIGLVNGNRFFMNAGASILGPALDDKWHVFIGVFDGANSVFSVDGIEYAGDAGSNQPVNLRLFSQGAATTPHVVGGVRMQAIYPGAMSQPDRQKLTAALMGRYKL